MTIYQWMITPQATITLDVAPVHVFLVYWVFSILGCIWALRRIYVNNDKSMWGQSPPYPPFGLIVFSAVMIAPVAMPFMVAYVLAVGYKPRPLP